MQRYFIKEGGEPYTEVTRGEYISKASRPDAVNFWHAVPVRVTTEFGTRFVHKVIQGQICETQEQIDALLSGQKPNNSKR